MEMTQRKLLIGARYLSFVVDNESYCMDILRVRELMGMTAITPLPRTAAFIKGVINLRGQIIPIVDLRTKFGLPFKDYTKRTCIIIVEVTYHDETIQMGVVVDAIQEVIRIPDDKLSKLSYINARIKAEYIRGIADTPEGMKIVLDITKVLNDEELTAVKQAAE